MTSTLDLADAYAAADATEHHSCLYGMPDEFQEAIADKQKARAALEQRIKELERDAKRYRAIREGLEVDQNHVGAAGIVVSLVDDFGGETLRNEAADDAIDRALSEAALTKAVEISQEYKLP